MRTDRYIYLPLDVKVRELEAKIFLAVRAALRGYRVVVGQKPKVQDIATIYPAGAYVGFAAIENSHKAYSSLVNRGHHLILMDEEGLITHEENVYAKTRLYKPTLEIASAMVVWGNRHADMVLRHRPDIQEKLLISGNPRADILRPEVRNLFREKIAEISSRYGPFILINSNFGGSNHFKGRGSYFESLRKSKVIDNPDLETYFSRYFDYRASVMNAFLKMLPDLCAAFPNHKVILRPHPSENHAVWNDVAADIINMRVIAEGSPVPWMFSADALIHNYCTTSVEYVVSGGVPVSYRPVVDDTLEHPLPTIISHVATDVYALCDAVQSQIQKKSIESPSENFKLRDWVANVDGGYASDAIIDFIDSLDVVDRRPRLMKAHSAVYRGRSFLSAAKAYTCGRQPNEYFHHKFPSLDYDEVRGLIDSCAPGRRIKIKKIDHMVYEISS